MITLKGVTKIYSNRVERVTALKNVNLSFEDKGMVFVSGYSGAGKSTLLSIIGGIDNASSGDVVIDNFSLKNLSSVELDRYRNNYVGFVFESIDLIDTMTVEENIKVSCAFNGNDPSESQMEYIIDKLKLGSIRKRKPNQISLGQKQKVGVARALAKNPYVYLADDPTGHVDAKRADEIWAILKEISKKRLVIAVSHDARIIEKYADRVITIDSGEVVNDVAYQSTQKSSKDSGVREVVGEIKDISQTKSASEIVGQKHKFSFKNLLWLTKNNLKFKPIRFISIILLTAFALMSFSMFNVLNRFDRVEVLAKSIEQNNMDYVTFIKKDENDIVTSKEYNEILFKHKANYGESFTPGKLIEFNGKMITKSGMLQQTKDFDISYIINQARTNEDQTFLGQEILEGQRPARDTDWMISDYVAEQMVRALGLDSQQKLIGVEFNTASYNLNVNQKVKVCGIYKTDYEKYVDKTTMLSNGYKPHEFSYNQKYIYSVAIVGDGYVKSVIENNSLSSNYVITAVDSISGSIYSSGSTLQVMKTNNMQSSGYYEVVDNKFVPRVSQKPDLVSNENTIFHEIVVSHTFFNNYYGSVGALINGGLTPEFLESEGSIDEVLDARYLKLAITMSFDGKHEETFYIKGIVTTNEIVVSDYDYDNIFSETKFKTKGVIVKAGSSENMMVSVIKDLESKDFKFTSTTSEKIEEFSKNISVFKSLLLVGSVLFASFVAVLIYYFVYTLIAERKKEIGILRAFGARGRDVLSIFLTTGVVMLLGIMVVGSVALGLGAYLGNVYAKASMATLFSAFNINVLDFLLLFGISLFMIFVGTLFPIVKYIKEDPYDNIKGR